MASLVLLLCTGSFSSPRDDRLTMSPKTDSDVAREIGDLHNRFSDLVCKVRLEIEDDIERRRTSHKRWVIKLQNGLFQLPPNIEPDHYEFLKENLDTISENRSVDKFFNYLNLYWSFIDFNLLEYLISKFGSEGLQAQMASYVADLVRFRKSTTVSQFAKHMHWPKFGGKKDPPPHFSELIAKLPDDPSSCTLEYVEELRMHFCREFFLSKSALVLAGQGLQKFKGQCVCARVKGQQVPTHRGPWVTIQDHCSDFVKYTHWVSLIPLLESQRLLDPDSTHHLQNPHTSNQEKGNHFYLTVLLSKGHEAYRRLYRCLAEEQEHAGHQSLLKLFLEE